MTSPSNPPRPARVQAILYELDRVADEYEITKEALDRAQVEFEAARDRFESVKELADSMLTTSDFWEWQESRPAVRYAAMPIASAIDSYLTSCALRDASAHVRLNEPYDPSRDLEQITSALEEGGFEFRTTSPRREVNGALTNLASIEQVGHRYKARNTDGILEYMKSWLNAPAHEQEDEPKQQ